MCSHFFSEMFLLANWYLMNVYAVSVHNVFTTIEVKGKVTTRISRDCQLQVVTVVSER